MGVSKNVELFLSDIKKRTRGRTRCVACTTSSWGSSGSNNTAQWRSSTTGEVTNTELWRLKSVQSWFINRRVSFAFQHGRQVRVKLQTVRHVRERAAQSRRLYPRQKVRARPRRRYQAAGDFNFLWTEFDVFCCGNSKKKRRVIYGKWTECMYSVDPKVYEAYKKSDKKMVGDSKKPKSVSDALIFFFQ